MSTKRVYGQHFHYHTICPSLFLSLFFASISYYYSYHKLLSFNVFKPTCHVSSSTFNANVSNYVFPLNVIDGETMETVRDFIFLSSKITAGGDCSHEIKRHLLLERKAMINLDNILKSRDITLSLKVCIVKAMVFPVVIYRCERP